MDRNIALCRNRHRDARHVGLISRLLRCSRELGEPSLEEPAFGLEPHECQGGTVGIRRLRRAPQPTEQFPPGSREKVISRQGPTRLDTIEEPKSGFGTVRHRYGHGMIEVDNRAGLEPLEQFIQGGDLAPIRSRRRRRLSMHRRDSRLGGVWPRVAGGAADLTRASPSSIST